MTPDESPTPDGTQDEHLIVFARIPRLGEVKTRLAAGLGVDGALAAYRELLDHALAQASACALRCLPASCSLQTRRLMAGNALPASSPR